MLYSEILCFIVQESRQLIGQEGKHFHQHLLLTVEYLCILKTQHSPFQLSSLNKEELALKLRQAPGSRLQLVNTEESWGHRTSQRACRKISTGKALPLSFLETCICLDQNIFLLDFHDSIWYHIVNRSDCLCRIGNQWVAKLFQAPLHARALLTSLSKGQLIH